MSVYALAKTVLHKRGSVMEIPVRDGTGARPRSESRQEALETIAKFIPSELLAPYLLLAQTISSSDHSGAPTLRHEAIYWAFVGLTPTYLVILQVSNAIGSPQDRPYLPHLAWRAVASSLAFGTWALCLPGNPYQEAVGGVAVACVVAMLISPLLSRVDSMVLRLCVTERP